MLKLDTPALAPLGEALSNEHHWASSLAKIRGSTPFPDMTVRYGSGRKFTGASNLLGPPFPVNKHRYTIQIYIYMFSEGGMWGEIRLLGPICWRRV